MFVNNELIIVLSRVLDMLICCVRNIDIIKFKFDLIIGI